MAVAEIHHYNQPPGILGRAFQRADSTVRIHENGVIDVYNQRASLWFGRWNQLPDVTAKIEDDTVDVYDQPEGVWTGRLLQRIDRTAIVHSSQIDYYDQPPRLLTGRLFQRASRSSVIEGGQFDVLSVALSMVGHEAPKLDQALVDRDGHFEFVPSDVQKPTI